MTRGEAAMRAARLFRASDDLRHRGLVQFARGARRQAEALYAFAHRPRDPIAAGQVAELFRFPDPCNRNVVRLPFRRDTQPGAAP